MLMPSVRDGVSFASFATGANGSAQSIENGTFALDGIPAGVYTVITTAGGGGVFQSFTNIVFNGSGTPLALADKNHPMPEPSLGTVEISVKDADVTDLRLVVKKKQ